MCKFCGYATQTGYPGEVHVDCAKKRIAQLEEALRPFGSSYIAEHVDSEGWTSNIHRDQISAWFGPTDFRNARAVLQSEGK